MTQIVLFGVFLVLVLAVMVFPRTGTAPTDTHESRKILRLRAPPLEARGRSWLLAVVSLGLLAVALVIRYDGRRTADPPLLAVLPFESIGAQEPYVAAGITDELKTRLSRVEGLRVASSSAARAMTSGGGPLATDVDFSLEGSVSLLDDGDSRRLRVRTRLVEVASATQIWGEVYDEPVSEIFAVEGLIAERVVTAMDLGVLRAEPPGIVEPRTEDFEAYERFLEGVAYRRSQRDLDNALAALWAFEEAASIDPGFAAAWAGQASIRSWLAYLHGFSGQVDSARALLIRAQSLDADDPDVGLVRAVQTWMLDRDYESALQQYLLLQHTVDATRRPVVEYYIALMHWHQGRHAAAIQHQRQALAGDPFLSFLGFGLAEMLLYDRLYPEAATALDRGLASGVGDRRAGRYAALLPILATGDTARAWANVAALGEGVLEEAMGSGLLPESRALTRIFAPRLLRLELGPQSAAAPATLRAGADLSRSVRDATLGDSGGYRLAAEQLRALAEEPSLAFRYRVLVRSALAVALAGDGKAGPARAVLAGLDPLSEHDPLHLPILAAMAEVGMLTGDLETAADALRSLLDLPSLVSPELLALDPLWAPLLRDARFARRLGVQG